MTETSIKATKAKWYIKNRERILKKARENYRKKVGLEPMRQRPKKIILTFD